MAKEKTSFVLYSDLIHSVNELSDKEAGILFKTILSYVNDENPSVKDKIIKLVFEPVKLQLKRDLKKYELKKDQWSKAGKASANKRSTVSTSVESRSTVSTVTVNDNVTVNVNDTDPVIDNVTVTEKKEEASPPKKFDLVFPFNSEDFMQNWDAWVMFRAEIKKPYQTFSEQQAALQFLSKHSESTAIEIILQSLRNKWKDFYTIKDDGKQRNSGSVKQNAIDKQSSVHALVNELRKSDQPDNGFNGV